jgi:hypothetical protein
MPKIPLYGEKIGATPLAAGSLGPRASIGTFTAPGRATAGFAKAAGDVAFRFGMAEKKAETERVLAESLSQESNNFDEFKRSQPARTVEGYNIVARNFKDDAMAKIDGLDLTQSQKQAVKIGLGKNLDLKIASERSQVFNRLQQDRSNAMNDGIAALISDTADPALRDSTLSDIQYLIDSGNSQGLAIKYDMPGVRGIVRYNDALADSTNPNYKLEDLKGKKDDILNGRGEYAETSPEERSKLGRVYQQRINELEFGVTAELQAQELDLYARIEKTGNDAGARELAQAYRDVGREDLAIQVGSKSYIGKVSYEFIEDSGLANNDKFNENLEEIMALPMDGDQAAENKAIQETALKFAASRRELLNTDPAQYVASQLQRQGKEVTPQAILAHQKNMGVELRPFTNEQAQQIQERLANTTGELDRLQILREFVYEFGGTDTPVDSELMLSLMPSAGFSFVDMVVASDPGRVINFSLLAADKADDGQLSERIKSKGFEPGEINNLVSEELDDYDGSVISGGQQSVLARTASGDAASHLLQVHETTAKLARYLVAFNNMNPKDAAKRAASLVNDKFMYPEVNNRTFVLPRKYENFSSEFENELTSVLFDDATFANVEIGSFTGDRTGELSRKQFMAEVRNGGRWATNAARNAVVLLDNTENMVIADGKPVMITFAELERRATAKIKTAETIEQTIESSTSQFQELNRQLRDEFGGRQRKAAKDAGRLDEFEAEKKRIEFQRDILESTIADQRRARNQ